MAELKTKLNDSSVEDFINALTDETKKRDSFKLLQIMQEITGKPPKMWGDSIIGFDSYHYKYDSGREGDFFITGFSPRKQALSIYIMAGFSRYKELMSQLGKYKTGKSCLYVKNLDAVDEGILKSLITESVNYMRKKYH